MTLAICKATQGLLQEASQTHKSGAT